MGYNIPVRIPSVSVIIALYNKGNLIKRAIESVLAQTFQDFEIIVVDDCSTDDGPDRVREFSDPRLRLIRTERNSGPSLARDTGIKASDADLIALLDADDEWRPGFLERCVRFMEAHPEAGLVATGYEIWEKGNQHSVVMDALEGIVENPFGLWREIFYVWTSAILLRRKAYLETGGFDPRLRYGEDVNLWLRIGMRYPIGYIPEALAIYHLEHPNRETGRWFLGKPKPWVLSEEFLPVPDEFKKTPAYESFLHLKALDAERYMRTWLSLGRFCHAREFARRHSLPFWRPLFQELPSLARNLRVILSAWVRFRIARPFG
jgi:glycosyltransferase involved in cell wall biosynthesis